VLLASGQPDSADAASPVDGVLEVRDVFNLTSAARVVTFSDASSLSLRDAAAALPSLYWGWRAAGVPVLLVRRWGGVEELSSTLLERFYEQLKNGATPSAALAAAQSSIRAEAGGRAPGAWAGWIMLTAASGPGPDGAAARR
jgi:hypothetical protein